MPQSIAVAVADADDILSVLSMVTVLPIPSVTVTETSLPLSSLLPPLFIVRATAAAAMITTIAMTATIILLLESMFTPWAANYLDITANGTTVPYSRI